MADLQKTIKGLRCHSEPKFGPDEYFCETCPYDEATCGLDVPNDALSMLKEHGAKVMSVEEAARNAYSFYHTPDSVKPVFVQFRDETYADEALTPPWRGGANQRALLKEPDRYGKDFVFWTDRPSEEQRKGVEWDGMDAISEFKHTLARLYQIPYDVLFPGERTDETLEKTKIAPAIPGFGSGTGLRRKPNGRKCHGTELDPALAGQPAGMDGAPEIPGQSY